MSEDPRICANCGYTGDVYRLDLGGKRLCDACWASLAEKWRFNVPQSDSIERIADALERIATALEHIDEYEDTRLKMGD